MIRRCPWNGEREINLTRNRTDKVLLCDSNQSWVRFKAYGVLFTFLSQNNPCSGEKPLIHEHQGYLNPDVRKRLIRTCWLSNCSSHNNYFNWIQAKGETKGLLPYKTVQQSLPFAHSWWEILMGDTKNQGSKWTFFIATVYHQSLQPTPQNRAADIHPYSMFQFYIWEEITQDSLI